ncbi:MAG TPA: ABC transporter permease [Spirochaetota bacterium]|nr:ABC transporter permease [Spirochaetota bacterium]
MSLVENKEKWSIIIKPKNKIFEINLKEFFEYADLLFLFVRRDFVAYYKQTILGPLWFLLQPILSTIVFTVIFGNIAKIPTDGVPQVLFYMAGIVCWNYFSTCLTTNSSTFLSNASIFGKVYFPRLIIPVSVVISNLFKFAIQFALFIFIGIYFYLKGSNITPNLWILFFPVLILQMGLISLGFGLLISAMTTKYRDLSFLVAFGIQLWMYATPIVYPISQIPEKWKFIFMINPMSSIVEVFRYSFLGSGGVDFQYIFVSLLVTVIIFIIGLLAFNKVEKTFMDMV